MIQLQRPAIPPFYFEIECPFFSLKFRLQSNRTLYGLNFRHFSVDTLTVLVFTIDIWRPRWYAAICRARLCDKNFLIWFSSRVYTTGASRSPLIEDALATYGWLISIENSDVEQKRVLRYIRSSSANRFHVFLIKLLNEKTFIMSFVSSKFSDWWPDPTWIQVFFL